MNNPIQVNRSSLPDFNAYKEEIRDLWESQWLTNMGVKHLQLELELTQYLNSSNITLFTNRNKNIYPRKYFYPLTNNFECYQGKFTSNETPVAKYIADRVLTLPLYADLKLEDIDRICTIIKS